jgi:hypothetical protein
MGRVIIWALPCRGCPLVKEIKDGINKCIGPGNSTSWPDTWQSTWGLYLL